MVIILIKKNLKKRLGINPSKAAMLRGVAISSPEFSGEPENLGLEIAWRRWAHAPAMRKELYRFYFYANFLFMHVIFFL